MLLLQKVALHLQTKLQGASIAHQKKIRGPELNPKKLQVLLHVLQVCFKIKVYAFNFYLKCAHYASCIFTAKSAHD